MPEGIWRRHYSGTESLRFWAVILHLPDPPLATLYALACNLQELEVTVLGALESAQAKGEEKNYA